jgi:acetyltransferase-like isoleucine patch superfamily enzyme
MNYEQTIREAHALLRAGHIADAIAALAVVVNSLPPVEVVAGDPCKADDEPDWMCAACDCWKRTRALCS